MATFWPLVRVVCEMMFFDRVTRRRGLALWPLFAVLSIAFPRAAIADPILKQTNETYDIRGSTIRELKAAMREHGPSGTGAPSADRNKIVVGRTSTTFAWTFQHVKTQDGCTAKSIAVTLEARVVMPLWTDKLLATYALQAEWDRYRADVERHEQRHVDIAFETARELERGLAEARSEKCGDLQAVMRAIAEGHMERDRRNQREFDAREGSCHLRKTCIKGM